MGFGWAAMLFGTPRGQRHFFLGSGEDRSTGICNRRATSLSMLGTTKGVGGTGSVLFGVFFHRSAFGLSNHRGPRSLHFNRAGTGEIPLEPSVAIDWHSDATRASQKPVLASAQQTLAPEHRRDSQRMTLFILAKPPH